MKLILILHQNVLEGYRVGAKENDKLSVLVPASSGISSEYSTRIACLTVVLQQDNIVQKNYSE